METIKQESKYSDYIRTIEDFPSPGIKFYDIAPLLGNAAVFKSLIRDMAEPLRGKVDKIAGFDARGFLFGGAIANEIDAGFVMLRKPGKLPGAVDSINYDLEYGQNSLEIQANSLELNDRVTLVDDVIATGGTGIAGIELVRKQGAVVVEFCSLINLVHLGGAEKITDNNCQVRALIEIDEGI